MAGVDAECNTSLKAVEVCTCRLHRGVCRAWVAQQAIQAAASALPILEHSHEVGKPL